MANINNDSWSITGSIVNNGTITLPSTSTVTFSGGAPQSISGNAFAVGNMAVNKTSQTLSNNTNVTLLGTLTMTTGTFDADGSGVGNFILKSDTNGDARIGVMAGGSITGEITFQRYFINTTVDRWRNFSFPVTSVDYSELAPLNLQTDKLAIYTESALGDVDQGWTYINSGALSNGKGHTAWMYNAQPITLSIKGPLLQNVPATPTNRYNFGVTYTPNAGPSDDGWNFVPNPFASPIDWSSASGWVKTNVNALAAVWDEENGIYNYSSGVMSLQGQGFWVQTNAASPDLRCDEGVKVNVLDPTFYRTAAEELKSQVLITLKSDKRFDETVIKFQEEATNEFDSQFDAHKLKNRIFNLSTLTDKGVNLAVNVLPRTKCGSLHKVKYYQHQPWNIFV